MITLVLYVWGDVGDSNNCRCLLCENQCVECVFLVLDKSDKRKLCLLIESDPGWDWNNPPYNHCLVYWPFLQEILWSGQRWSTLKEPAMQIFFVSLVRAWASWNRVTGKTIHCYAYVFANNSPLYGEAFPLVVSWSNGPVQARENLENFLITTSTIDLRWLYDISLLTRAPEYFIVRHGLHLRLRFLINSVALLD